jgi:hypothetical protein
MIVAEAHFFSPCPSQRRLRFFPIRKTGTKRKQSSTPTASTSNGKVMGSKELAQLWVCFYLFVFSFALWYSFLHSFLRNRRNIKATKKP